MSQLTVRCFGGLDVRIDKRPVTGLESQKVKALLVYLIVHRERSFSREQLAALLWPDELDGPARRNMRQAIYNLKSTLTRDGAESPILTGSELQIDPALDCWLDVEAFEEARRQGSSGGVVDPHYLTAAAALYRGDFLAGFNLKNSPDFEFWQLAQQERLRDRAVETLRTLVDSYLSRGEFRLGLQYARRLVAIDPLSEEAQRYLIRLFALNGQRSRSLAQYEDLRDTLLRELGVEPLEETRSLYEAVLTDKDSIQPEVEESKGIGPLIPLVGRQESYARLRDCWQTVLTGRCCFTVVEGEAGVGKNRLVKSFLDAACSRRLTTVLKGACNDQIPVGYQPFAQALRNAVAAEGPRSSRVLSSTSADSLAHLALLAPELRRLSHDVPPSPKLATRQDRIRLFECCASFLESLCLPDDGGPPDRPLVLMLGELQWTSSETVDLFEYLLVRLASVPVWLLGTHTTGDKARDSPLQQRAAGDEGPIPLTRIALERLAPESVHELASTLVGDDHATELAEFLILHGQGLPLAIAEWINSLWDDGLLARDAGRWHLRDSLAGLGGDLDALISSRLGRLPTSTRRLASQAAVIGQQFDAELLAGAANEHLAVVEIGLELMLERWLIRQHSDYWRTGRRERDIVLWAKGARRGSFEFNHPLIRRTILDDVNPLRRQVMHREVGEALEQELGEESGRLCEVLAFHFAQAGEWERAIPHLEEAARRARSLLAADTARRYTRQAIEVLNRLEAGARKPETAGAWRRRREEMAASLDEL
ncbi:MAG: AAA family ATPase [bacterium]|nr:AAA family ATPase [bacterium]